MHCQEFRDLLWVGWFIDRVRQEDGVAISNRQILEAGGLPGVQDQWALQEAPSAYNAHFDGKMGILRLENRLYWNVYH